jgi:hypothetical protein
LNGHDSPLVRFLRNPSRSLEHALAALEHLLSQALPLTAIVCGVVAALLIARLLLVRLRERRLARDARLIRLAVPPELKPEGALLLWSALHDLLRPRLARLLSGQPQLAWEIAADRAGSHFQLWVPHAVPPGLVERALAAAWPGITTTVLDKTRSDQSKDDEANANDESRPEQN